MANFWRLGGLSLADLARRTVRESWEDSVFGQGGRMAFYHFLAIFPSLIVFLAICARVPNLGDHMKTALQDLSSQVLPEQVWQLIQKAIEDPALSGARLVSACAAALWAAMNGTWAMVYGLNRAYEVKESRVWWKLWLTIAGLTLSLAFTASIAGFVVLYGARFHWGGIALHFLQWLILAAALYLSFAVLYSFAPDVRDRQWRWNTPGALCALILWIGSTLAVRVYFDHVNNYASSYGHLNGVAMLLLWLYFTNGAVLVGGEMNSEIDKAYRESRK
jgi:membrane protein